jgi:CMP/dCMP kinase
VTYEERRLNEFVRAALLSFGPARDVRALALSAGGSNRVFRATAGTQRVVVKLRTDRDDAAAREAWALRASPRDVAPRLLGHTTPRVLVAAAAERGDFVRAARLDAPVGGVLVLSHVEGTRPRGPLDAAAWRRIARALRRLHAVRAAGPPVHVGLSPGSAARLAADRVQALRDWDAIDRAAARDLSRMLRRAHDAARRAPRLPGPRLCHGDLRLHNLIDDGARTWLIDFEHAGLGDPVADLLLFSLRTPLPRHDEQLLWEALLDPSLDESAPRTRRDLESFYRQRPLFSLVSAVAALSDVVGVARGARPVADGARAYVEARFEGARTEMAEVLGRPVSKRAPRAAKSPPRARLRGIVTVDGTASSGKSIVAAGLAEALGARHLNTGLLFRAAAFLALERGWAADASGAARVAVLVARTKMTLLDRDSVRVGSRVLDEALATLEIEAVVARLALHAPLRNAIAAHIDAVVGRGGVIVEGRAMAARFPDARAALFVDADPLVRADRLRGRVGRTISRAAAHSLLRRRDGLDRARALEPNVAAPHAIVLDTTAGREQDSVARALSLLGARVRRP